MIDISGLLDSIETYAQDVGQVTRDELERIVKDAAPVVSGEMRDAISVEVSGGSGSISLTVESPTEQSSYTDDGTQPHDIVGNPLLAFEMNGALVIVHSVHHPGTTAQKWFEEPMEGYFQDALDVAASQVTV